MGMTDVFLGNVTSWWDVPPPHGKPSSHPLQEPNGADRLHTSQSHLRGGLFSKKNKWCACFSPPVRWGLLDFMSVSSPSPTSSPPSCRPPPRRISTAILWVQCGVPDLNRDPVSSVWRAGPQPRAREFSVACRTPTASSWVQCGVPDPNRELVSWVWRPGPQPRSCEFSVASRTPTAILWVQCGVPDLKYCVRKFVRKNDRRYVRKNVRRYVRRNVRKNVRR